MNRPPPDCVRRARAIARAAGDWLDVSCDDRDNAIRETLRLDNTFTAEAIQEGVRLAMTRLTEKDLLDWVGCPPHASSETVAVLNAGNVPLVGLQDFLGVVLMGFRYVGITSSRSPFLLPAFARTVGRTEPDLPIEFTTLANAQRLATVLIATGSTATTHRVSRQFAEAGLPIERQLLRASRLGAAILDGDETDADLLLLARDVLLHEGRGCRSVANILAPVELDPDRFVEQVDGFRRNFPAHPSTRECVDRTLRLLHAVEANFRMGDGMLLIEDDVVLREPCVVRWLRYDGAADVVQWLRQHERLLQIVVAKERWQQWLPNHIDRANFGEGQNPALGWCPDGLDTIAFLKRCGLPGI